MIRILLALFIACSTLLSLVPGAHAADHCEAQKSCAEEWLNASKLPSPEDQPDAVPCECPAHHHSHCSHHAWPNPRSVTFVVTSNGSDRHHLKAVISAPSAPVLDGPFQPPKA